MMSPVSRLPSVTSRRFGFAEPLLLNATRHAQMHLTSPAVETCPQRKRAGATGAGAQAPTDSQGPCVAPGTISTLTHAQIRSTANLSQPIA